MKRLIITGLPCPPDAWEKFLGKRRGQKILPLIDVFEHTDSADLRVMSRYVSDVISEYRPSSIVCHDLGVPLTMLGLLRLKRDSKMPSTRITFFNGAFRKMNIFQANHVFRIQWMSYRKGVSEIENNGGEVDLRLKKYLPRLRAMYRLIILYSLVEKVQSVLGLDDFVGHGNKPLLRVPVQTIFSPNDPYIPKESLDQLRKDFPPQRRFEIPYGHFPYSIPSKEVLPLIEEFEEGSTFTVPQGPRSKYRSIR
jgi:pimeloyl-ACP methyl ester carboxylesterase